MISYVGIIHILQKLTKNEKIGPTVQESMKGGLVTGLTTLVGGLAFGVMGIVVGSSAGGILAYACSKGNLSCPANSLLTESYSFIFFSARFQIYSDNNRRVIIRGATRTGSVSDAVPEHQRH